MAKKILIFSLAYYPKHVGGAEVAIKEITDRISPDEIEFHMITNRYDSTLPKVEKIGNVMVHRIGIAIKYPTMVDLKRFPLKLNKYLYQFTAAFYAWRLHKKERFDGMWAMMAHSCGVPAGLFKTFFPKVTYVLTLQEGDPTEHIERLAKPVWPLFVRGFTKADVVQTISTFLARWAKKMGYEGPLEVIPNAVHTAHFTQHFSEEEITAKQQQLGKKEGDVFLVTTSRLVHKNAVDDVIRAMALLPKNVHFVIYGTGPDEGALRARAGEKCVEDRVHFMGHIDHKDMPLALKACDIFIRPSRSEGMGNSFVEAMAAGLPVVATQEGGIADFLFDAQKNPDKQTTGWAVTKDSPEEISRAILDIIKHPEKVTEVTNTAKAMVIEKYDWEIIARDMKEKVFSKV